jgi:hypothetical protein
VETSGESKQLWQKAGFFATGCVSSYIRSAPEGMLPSKRVKIIMRIQEKRVKEHKYRIGQTVLFMSRLIGHMSPNGTYEIVRLLPSDGADFQYRIRNPKEAFERVARESQLEGSH